MKKEIRQRLVDIMEVNQEDEMTIRKDFIQPRPRR